MHSFWTGKTALNPNEIMVGLVCKRHQCITLPQERQEWRRKGHILSESERTFTHSAAVAPLWDYVIHSRKKLNIITECKRHFSSDVAEGKFPKSRFISNIHLERAHRKCLEMRGPKGDCTNLPSVTFRAGQSISMS